MSCYNRVLFATIQPFTKSLIVTKIHLTWGNMYPSDRCIEMVNNRTIPFLSCQQIRHLFCAAPSNSLHVLRKRLTRLDAPGHLKSSSVVTMGGSTSSRYPNIKPTSSHYTPFTVYGKQLGPCLAPLTPTSSHMLTSAHMY